MEYRREFLADVWRRMLCIRIFEDTAAELHKHGEIPGSLHTSHGQEAEIVGACTAVRRDDYMVGNHRSHGHPIAKGADLRGLMAELFAKRTGVCSGKGGSMHLADFSVGSLGETSIVGSGIPVAAGAALGAKMQRLDRVSLCFFGDGASSQGTFHETLNMASIWKLPAIFLCENNGYGQLTPASRAIAIENIADRAAGYSMPGIVVDGQDVLQVHEAVASAVVRARAGHGPTLVEAKTYRYRDHAANMGRNLGYRSEEEVERWLARDPLILFKRQLCDVFSFTQGELDVVEREVRAEVESAVAFARSSDYPDPAEAFVDIFANTLEKVR